MTVPAALPPIQLFDGIARSTWAYPALEVVHIVGIALLVGNLVLLEWRVWLSVSDIPPRALARLALPLALVGFVLIGLSGMTMFATQPAELLANRAFLAKLGLVSLAGLNAVFFHVRGSLAKLDLLAKLQTVLSLGLWVGAIICGRWIAYA